MSTFESSHKSLLLGVSQQVPEERLTGQLTAQLNMLSDPVTNLRRRPGMEFKHQFNWDGVLPHRIKAWFTDVAGVRCHILLNTVNGNIRMLDESYGVIKDLAGGSYLTTSNPESIRATTVGNEFFLANVEKSPQLVYTTPSIDSAKAGFFYVVAGAFGKGFEVTVVTPTGNSNATYTTPGGTGAGDSALATPEYIATQLANQLAGNPSLAVYRDGPYVYIQHSSGNISVNSSSGTAYLIASKGGSITAAGNLPARLPAQANGYVTKVGSGSTPQYFKYNHPTTEWVEVGAPGSPTGISNVPISIYYTGTEFALNTSNFEGRNAGDDISNKPHEFMQFGITGIATYQGRLVIMSGPLVSLSAASASRRFFRSTVTSVLAGDAIETGSNQNSSASYEYGLSFQKDLLLFSKAYQAVLPSSNAAISPNTATVVPTSSYEVDTTCAPILLGRTLMYTVPRSADFFGCMEMIPSPYTDSQYVSQEATPHLPKYMPGRCRFAVSSSVSNIALFGPTGDYRSVVVYEYMWDGDNKAQQAWHTWTFPYDISAAYFASEKIVMVMVNNGKVVLGELDTKAGVLTQTSQKRPYLDLYVPVTVVNNTATLPGWMLEFDPSIGDKLKLAILTGNMAGEAAGMTITGGTINTVLSHKEGQYAVGINYLSSVSPTPPVIRDYSDVAIKTTKATVLRYNLGTRNSGHFKVRVSDRYSTEVDEREYSPLLYSSPDLRPGYALTSDRGITVIPCRTDMASTHLEIFTDDLSELNITSLEYVGKFNQKIRRR